MLIVIAIAIGLVGGWVYAGCPLPRTLSGALSSRRPPAERPVAEVSPPPVRGASPARP
jgi:hypothetical protein